MSPHPIVWKGLFFEGDLFAWSSSRIMIIIISKLSPQRGHIKR